MRVADERASWFRSQVGTFTYQAGCLDACSQGPAVVVYPEGVWYGHVKVEDVPEIVESHLVRGQPVERLRLRELLAAGLTELGEEVSMMTRIGVGPGRKVARVRASTR